MNELQIINENGKLYADSRQVAEMVGKLHKNLLKSIDSYVEVLESSKLSSQNFFIKSTYKAEGNNKTYPCYKLTRKGCDMVANKLTGEKGVLFTAEYVTRFEEMEKQLQQKIDLDPNKLLDVMAKQILSMQQQQNKIIELKNFTQDHDNRIIQLEKTLQGIRELEELNSSNWRIHSRIIINKIADKYPTLNGINKYQATRHELYQRLNAEAHCNLEKRLQYRKERAYRAGASKKYIANISKLDVISEDVRLTNCAINALKQMALEYGVYE
jgi:Rha family phage regulatory protein